METTIVAYNDFDYTIGLGSAILVAQDGTKKRGVCCFFPFLGVSFLEDKERNFIGLEVDQTLTNILIGKEIFLCTEEKELYNVLFNNKGIRL